MFAALSGDVNPRHLDAEFAASTGEGVIAHGMWGAALISAVLGTRLPGAGTVYERQTLNFRAPIRAGDTLTTTVKVTARDERENLVTLDCTCVNQRGETVIAGEAIVTAPTERIERSRSTLPQVRISVSQGDDLVRLLQLVRPLGPLRMAVVYPTDAVSLSAALDAREAGLIEPVLVGPRARLEAIARESGLSLDGVADRGPAGPACRGRARRRARVQGSVGALMKGNLHTDELMAAVVASALRTSRRISHCFVMQTPAYPRPFLITDAAINIAPTLQDKLDIVRNAVDLAHAFGIERPRVAVLAAVETVNPHMPATLDAAALCKMADRGQIAGAVVDGPLAFDNAVSAAAARTKGIVSPWPAWPTSWSCPTSRAATCWRSSSSTWAAPRARASCSVRACRSCLRAGQTRAKRASRRARSRWSRPVRARSARARPWASSVVGAAMRFAAAAPPAELEA